MNNKQFISLLTLIFTVVHSFAQMDEAEISNSSQLNWQNKDWNTDKIAGVGTERAYNEFLKNKTVKKTVVVAVLDSGVDIEHKDFEGKIWINEDEIAGNGIDDDNNGYVDDINGWNYLGNEYGENLLTENLEYTRLYKEYVVLTNSNNLGSIKEGSFEDLQYKKAVEQFAKEMEFSNNNLKDIDGALTSIQLAKQVLMETTGKEANTLEDLSTIKGNDDNSVRAKSFLTRLYAEGYNEDVLSEMKERNLTSVNTHLNVNLNARELVGDNPFDINDKAYGNPNVAGPEPDHGTGCAGLIAAVRNNGVGIDGVAEHVKIMSLRTTPDGDERDKDVALAIMYAADNGADIINMSFGKDYSPQKEFVDEAVKYAESKGVLMVHSAGNGGRNIVDVPSFPNKKYLTGSSATNWITVGASEEQLDKNLVAIFSNYGYGVVDILAPGVDIISLDMDNKYSQHNGTSFSGPVVSGVAALIWSYYPDLTAQDMIQLLIETSKTKKPKKVYLPSLEGGKRAKAKIKEVSTDGGVVSAYRAIKALEERVGRN